MYGGYEYVIISLDEILATAAGSETCYFVGVDLEHTGTSKKQDSFHYALNLRKLTKSFFKDLMKKNFATYSKTCKKMICNWTDNVFFSNKLEFKKTMCKWI